VNTILGWDVLVRCTVGIDVRLFDDSNTDPKEVLVKKFKAKFEDEQNKTSRILYI